MPVLPSSPLLPWNDRAGRFSALRAVVFAGLCLPAVLLAARVLGDDLGPRPWTEAIHVSGDWAVRLLVVTIAVTPLRILSARSQLIGVRRMIGLAVLAWVGVHVTLYAFDKGGDLGVIASELALRPYLTIGFVAAVGLVALGVTSRDAAIRRMGGATWKRLHGLVHPITVLVIVHAFLQSKLDLAQGAILTGVACGGLAVRVATDRGIDGPRAVAAAAITGFVTAAGAEAAWFALKTGRSVVPLLTTDFDLSVRVAPAWVAMVITLAAGVVALLLRRPASIRRERVSAA